MIQLGPLYEFDPTVRMIHWDCPAYDWVSVSTMEKYLTALLTQKILRGQEGYFSSEGSAILALRRESSYYLIATRHQASHLRVATQSWVYLPTLDKVEPVTVVVESQTADVALLRFETTAELETINQCMRLGNVNWTIDYNDHQVLVYGFPKQDNGRSREMGEVINSLKLRNTLASLVGVVYDSDDGLRLMIDQSIQRGESGGLTVSLSLRDSLSLEDSPIGVNQGRRVGQGGLVTPLWETIALFSSLGLI